MPECMNCPKCSASALAPVAMRPGLQVDLCNACGGLWLDKSEIYSFVQRPQQVFESLRQAYKGAVRSELLCPRCRKSLSRVRIPGSDLLIEACPACGGNWFDKGEVQALNRFLDASAAAPPEPRPEPKAPAARAAQPRSLEAAEIERLSSVPGLSLPICLLYGLAGAGFATFLLALLWTAVRAAWPLAFLGGAALLTGAVYVASRPRVASYLEGALAVEGEVVGYGDQLMDRVVLKFVFELEGRRHEAARPVASGGPLDLGVGARVLVAVNPADPARARLIGAAQDRQERRSS